MFIKDGTRPALYMLLLTLIAGAVQLHLMWRPADARFFAVELQHTGEEQAADKRFSIDIISFPQSRVLTHASLGNLGVREWFTLTLTGCFRLSQADRLAFHTRSDDGFVLTIDGRVVQAHPEPRAMASSSIVVPLAAGLHAMSCTWFQRKGYMGLELTYRGATDTRERFLGESSASLEFIPIDRWSEEGCRAEIDKQIAAGEGGEDS